MHRTLSDLHCYCDVEDVCLDVGTIEHVGGEVSVLR
jgi:hypothetical protein